MKPSPTTFQPILERRHAAIDGDHHRRASRSQPVDGDVHDGPPDPAPLLGGVDGHTPQLEPAVPRRAECGHADHGTVLAEGSEVQGAGLFILREPFGVMRVIGSEDPPAQRPCLGTGDDAHPHTASLRPVRGPPLGGRRNPSGDPLRPPLPTRVPSPGGHPCPSAPNLTR